MKIFLFIFISLCIYSCNKNTTSQVVTSPPSELQGLWILDSIIVYENSDFSGYRFVGYIGNNTQYFQFNNNGKLYIYAGVPIPTFDTADYVILPDKYTLLTYHYINGIRYSKPDTATIRVHTATSLILGARNRANEYGKFAFKKS